jgi:hypothetical protein
MIYLSIGNIPCNSKGEDMPSNGLFKRKEVVARGDLNIKSQGHHWGVKPLSVKAGDRLNLMKAGNLRHPQSESYFVMSVNGEDTECHYGYLVPKQHPLLKETR